MNELDIPEHLINMGNEMLRIAKAMSQNKPGVVTPEERMKYTGTTTDQHGNTSHNYEVKGDMEVFKVPSNSVKYIEYINPNGEAHSFCALTKNKIYPVVNFDIHGYEIKNDKDCSMWYSADKFQASTLEAYTRQELLERAKREYPKGTKFKSADSNSNGDIRVSGGDLRYGHCFVNDIFNYKSDGTAFGLIYDKGKNEWAEIIPPTPVIDFDYCLKEFQDRYEFKSSTSSDYVLYLAMKNLDPTICSPFELKLIAFAKELIVSTVLNGEAKEKNWWIIVNRNSADYVITSFTEVTESGQPYASESIAKQAIEILGEDTIKRARV